MTQKEIDEKQSNMYRMILESDKTSVEAKWEAEYWLYRMERDHLKTDITDGFKETPSTNPYDFLARS